MAALIFDLDGTLIDSAPDIHAALARTLAEEGANPLPLDQVIGFIGNGVPVLIERVMRARGESADSERHADLLGRFMGHYDAAPADLTRLYPGVSDALHALAHAGHRCALCTNKPARTASAILESFNIADLFAAIVGGDTLPVKKPDPAPLLAAAEAMKAYPAIYVGDSEIDAETAAAAGLPFFLFTRGYPKRPLEEIERDAAFDAFADLPALVRDHLVARART